MTKRPLRNALLALPVSLVPALPAVADGHVTLETDAQKGAYAVGMLIGQRITSQFEETGIDMDSFAAGLADVLRGDATAMEMSAAEALGPGFMTELQAQLSAKQAAEAAAIAAANQAEGEAFLAENATAEGVTVTESGLQYKVLAEGEGDSPTISDTVSVHYTGRLLDGTVFDSSVARGTPATFPVSGVIAGWTEALQLMKPGTKFEVWIPSEIGYGARGAGDDIGPNAVLNFEMELLEIL